MNVIKICEHCDELYESPDFTRCPSCNSDLKTYLDVGLKLDLDILCVSCNEYYQKTAENTCPSCSSNQIIDRDVAQTIEQRMGVDGRYSMEYIHHLLDVEIGTDSANYCLAQLVQKKKNLDVAINNTSSYTGIPINELRTVLQNETNDRAD